MGDLGVACEKGGKGRVVPHTDQRDATRQAPTGPRCHRCGNAWSYVVRLERERDQLAEALRDADDLLRRLSVWTANTAESARVSTAKLQGKINAALDLAAPDEDGHDGA